jgi:integrase
MKQAEAAVYLDELRPKKSGMCSVKIRVTFNRTRKYYSTNVEMLPAEFQLIEKANKEEKLTKKEKEQLKNAKEAFKGIDVFLTKAKTILNKFVQKDEVFTFDKFNEAYFEKRNVYNSVSFAFDKYIEQLKAQERVGTASSFECAKVSLESFKKNLTFAEITPSFLKSYEAYMKRNGRSQTTVGIYLRSLRAVFNSQNISSDLYPFGDKEGKYKIRSGSNTKKAIDVHEIAQLYQYKPEPKSATDRAKDYWFFLYLCNGMNVKDFCLLRWKNIDGNVLTYIRAKTERSNNKTEEIKVSLKPETMEIIQKWAQPSLNKEAFLFPHIEEGMSAEKQRAVYQQVTKTINKYMNRICAEIGIEKNVTTYVARHSFATVLKNSGTSIEMISELLGHSSVEVTKNYLASFKIDQIHEQTNALTAGFSNAV